MNRQEIAEIAAHKVINPKRFSKLSPNLDPGITPIDMSIRIVGALKRGDPYQKRNAAKANPWKLLAKALSKLNQTTIDSLVAESIAVSEDESSAVQKKAHDAIARIVAETETDMPGNVTSTLKLILT